MRGQDLAGLQRSEIGALVEVPGRHACARRPCRPADSSRQGTSSAPACRCRDRRWRHCRRGCRRSAPADRRSAAAVSRRIGIALASSSEATRSCWVVIAPMTIVAALPPDAAELGDAAEIDQMLGRGQAQLHHRDQAVAAGQRPGLVAEIGKQLDRFADGTRPVVSKVTWDHCSLPERFIPETRPVLDRRPSLAGEARFVCGAAATDAAPAAGSCGSGERMAAPLHEWRREKGAKPGPSGNQGFVLHRGKTVSSSPRFAP